MSRLDSFRPLRHYLYVAAAFAAPTFRLYGSIATVAMSSHPLTAEVTVNPVTLASIVTAAATIAIACYAGASYLLAKRSGERDEEFRRKLADLYQAITVATLLGRAVEARRFEDGRKIFGRYYQGTTPIFPAGSGT